MARIFFHLVGICIAIVLPIPVFAANFSDVYSSDLYTSENHESIDWGVQKNILQGFSDNTFRPENEVSRAEFLKIVLLQKYSPEEITQATNSPAVFSDVSPSDWFYPYVQFAQQKGIIKGYADGIFKPHDPVTFGEGSKIIVEGIIDNNLFSSDDQDWAIPYISYLLEKKIYSFDIRSDFDPSLYAFAEKKIKRGNAISLLYFLEFPEKNTTFLHPRSSDGSIAYSIQTNGSIFTFVETQKEFIIFENATHFYTASIFGGFEYGDLESKEYKTVFYGNSQEGGLSSVYKSENNYKIGNTLFPAKSSQFFVSADTKDYILWGDAFFYHSGGFFMNKGEVFPDYYFQTFEPLDVMHAYPGWSYFIAKDRAHNTLYIYISPEESTDTKWDGLVISKNPIIDVVSFEYLGGVNFKKYFKDTKGYYLLDLQKEKELIAVPVSEIPKF